MFSEFIASFVATSISMPVSKSIMSKIIKLPLLSKPTEMIFVLYERCC